MATFVLTPNFPAQSEDLVQGTHIRFERDRLQEHGTTQIWFVMAGERDVLGSIHWFGRWRKYAFFPNMQTVYEEVCLHEIADFVADLTKAQRQKHKAKKGTR